MIDVSGEPNSVPVPIPKTQRLIWHGMASAMDLVHVLLNTGDHVNRERSSTVPSNMMTLYKQLSLLTLFNQEAHLEQYVRNFVHPLLMHLYQLMGVHNSELHHHINIQAALQQAYEELYTNTSNQLGSHAAAIK